MIELFEWMAMHPDVTLMVSFEDGQYLRVSMIAGMIKRVRIFTDIDRQCLRLFAKSVLDTEYSELMREVEKWTHNSNDQREVE